MRGQRSRTLGWLTLRRKMRLIFQKEDWRTSNLVQGWSTMISIIDIRSDVKGQRSKVKVIRSCCHSDAYLPITGQREVAEIPELAGRLSMPRLTFTSGQKVKTSKSPGCLTLWQKISHIFGTGRSTIFRVGIIGYSKENLKIHMGSPPLLPSLTLHPLLPPAFPFLSPSLPSYILFP